MAWISVQVMGLSLWISTSIANLKKALEKQEVHKDRYYKMKMVKPLRD